MERQTRLAFHRRVASPRERAERKMRRTVAAPWAQARRIGRKGGRDSASAGRGKGEGRDMANGAGIAADPTLTGVWMLRPCGMSGEPSILASVSACFRARCLASCRPVLRPACQRFVTGARAGIRLSLLPGLASTASTEVARMSAALHIRLAETASLCLCRSAADVGLSPFPLPFFRARFLACPVPPCRASPGEPTCLRPEPPACRLGSARGQMSPPSLGSKTTGI